MRLDLQRATGNFWIDTGLVVLSQMFQEGGYSASHIIEKLQNKLTEKTKNVGWYYDRNTDQLRQYGKTNWVYPVNLFIKVAGDSGKKVTIGGKRYPTQPPTLQLKLDLSKKPANCDICGQPDYVTVAKMWMFPFLVDPNKFGNFYSGVKRGTRLCGRCALAGLAAYLGWLWRAQGQDALHFFIFHSDLEEMKRLYRTVLDVFRLQGDKGGNAPVAFAGPYVHETTLGLLLRLFSYIRSSGDLGEEGSATLARIFGATPDPPPPLTLYAISGKPARAFDMTDLREFSRLHDLFRLYERWLKVVSNIAQNPHQRVVKVFEQFRTQQNKKWETLWRDRIAWAVLNFDDPFPFVEQFLFERAREENPRPLVAGTMDVLAQYAQEVMGMDEQFQRILAGFGHQLGEEAHSKNEGGLLYDLRNAKNPEAFYRVLNDAQFRLEITVPEALLRIEKGERVAGMPWIRVKTILSIYAMNAFLRKESGQFGRSEAREEVQE